MALPRSGSGSFREELLDDFRNSLQCDELPVSVIHHVAASLGDNPDNFSARIEHRATTHTGNKCSVPKTMLQVLGVSCVEQDSSLPMIALSSPRCAIQLLFSRVHLLPPNRDVPGQVLDSIPCASATRNSVAFQLQ